LLSALETVLRAFGQHGRDKKMPQIESEEPEKFTIPLPAS